MRQVQQPKVPVQVQQQGDCIDLLLATTQLDIPKNYGNNKQRRASKGPGGGIKSYLGILPAILAPTGAAKYKTDKADVPLE